MQCHYFLHVAHSTQPGRNSQQTPNCSSLIFTFVRFRFLYHSHFLFPSSFSISKQISYTKQKKCSNKSRVKSAKQTTTQKWETNAKVKGFLHRIRSASYGFNRIVKRLNRMCNNIWIVNKWCYWDFHTNTLLLKSSDIPWEWCCIQCKYIFDWHNSKEYFMRLGNLVGAGDDAEKMYPIEWTHSLNYTDMKWTVRTHQRYFPIESFDIDRLCRQIKRIHEAIRCDSFFLFRYSSHSISYTMTTKSFVIFDATKKKEEEKNERMKKNDLCHH